MGYFGLSTLTHKPDLVKNGPKRREGAKNDQKYIHMVYE